MEISFHRKLSIPSGLQSPLLADLCRLYPAAAVSSDLGRCRPHNVPSGCMNVVTDPVALLGASRLSGRWLSHYFHSAPLMLLETLGDDWYELKKADFEYVCFCMHECERQRAGAGG